MKTNQNTRLLDGKNREYNVVLALGGRGCRKAAGEGELNEKFLKDTPSSVRWTPSPSRVEGNNGFTLIELLVVVLIIGILASVALPQYNKAVMKARATEIKSFIANVEKAMDLYLLEKDGYPASDAIIPWDELNIDVSNYCSEPNSALYSCIAKNWTVEGPHIESTRWSIYIYPHSDVFGSSEIDLVY